MIPLRILKRHLFWHGEQWEKETEEEKRERKENIDIKDYGDRGSEYASGISKDYIKGKKGYI